MIYERRICIYIGVGVLPHLFKWGGDQRVVLTRPRGAGWFAKISRGVHVNIADLLRGRCLSITTRFDESSGRLTSACRATWDSDVSPSSWT